jgi:hypothetical protein
MKSSFNTNAAQSNSRRFWKTTSNFGKPEYRVSREAYEAAHLEAERLDTVGDARRFADELPELPATAAEIRRERLKCAGFILLALLVALLIYWCIDAGFRAELEGMMQ